MKAQDQSRPAPPTQKEAASPLLDEILARGVAPQAAAQQAAVVVGTVSAAGPELRVSWDGQDEPMAARSTVTIGPEDAGRQVTLQFEDGDAARPIVTGVLQGSRVEPAPTVGVEVDGHALVLEGQEQVVLRCGKASITLTRAGKVLVQGAYVSSRSTGIQRILGGSVEIN